MRENNQLSERRTKISLVTDLHCIHKVDSMECILAGPLLLECESSIQGRKKKKKKKQKARQIVELNTPSLLDKEKISVKECSMKNGSCLLLLKETPMIQRVQKDLKFHRILMSIMSKKVEVWSLLHL